MAIDYYFQWTYLCSSKLIYSIMKYVHRIEKWELWLVMLPAFSRFSLSSIVRAPVIMIRTYSQALGKSNGKR